MITKIKQYFHQPNFKKKLLTVLLGVFLMGFFLSFLIPVNLGTDPYTFFNLTISSRLHVLFGTCQMLTNLVLMILVLFLDHHQIGIGTLANMVLVGYVADLFRFIWSKMLPTFLFTQFPARAIVLAFALVGFAISASLYMNAQMGVSPYDALPNILHKRLFSRIPFRFLRIGYDLLVIGIGMLLGGIPNIGIVLMALLLGPTITWIGARLKFD